MNHTKKTKYILCGRRRETSASEIMEKMLDQGLYWHIHRSLRIRLCCEVEGRIRMRKYRMILQSSPELEGRLTLLAAESDYPAPYGKNAEDWYPAILPRHELRPRLLEAAGTIRGESREYALLRAMIRVIETTPEPRDWIMTW